MSDGEDAGKVMDFEFSGGGGDKEPTPNVEIEQALSSKIHQFIRYRDLYEFMVAVLRHCEEREIRNILLYESFLRSAFDGFVVGFANFGKAMESLLGEIRAKHLPNLKRNRAAKDKSGDSYINGIVRKNFEEVYDRVFPDVKTGNKGRPSGTAIDELREALRSSLERVQAHRDTAVAHWDPRQEFASFGDFEAALKHVQQLLSDLYFLFKLGVYSFEMGGGADRRRSACDFAEQIHETDELRRIVAYQQSLRSARSSRSKKGEEDDLSDGEMAPQARRMVAFMPWCHTQKEADIREFVVSPYDKLDCLPRTDFTIVDTLLRSYREPWGLTKPPVEQATALRFKDQGFASAYTDEQREALADLALVLAMDGLAQRSFFGVGAEYCNSDHFKMVVQAFTKLPDGVFIVPRRRGALSGTYSSVGVFEEARPPHVSKIKYNVDVAFCCSLLDAFRHEEHGRRFRTAVLFFVQGSTDAPPVSDATDCILIASAFQSLLQESETKKLKVPFAERMKHWSAVEPKDCVRVESRVRSGGNGSVSQYWMDDFAIMRGQVAHGNEPAARLWNLHEHLVLASFVFPLILKLELQSLKLYQLTDDDRVRLNSFERLACLKTMNRSEDEELRGEGWPWDNVLNDVRWNGHFSAVMDKLMNAKDEQG